MTVFEIIICCNLVVSLYLAWKINQIDEDLDDLESFSVQSIMHLAKQLENIENERDKDTR